MSEKMKNNVTRELMGQIPGLPGDPRFGAEEVPDLIVSGMVERVAIAQHCKNCDSCSAAANCDSSSAAATDLSSETEDAEDSEDQV